MKKPDRELLSFMIYDLGLDEALEHYQLTSEEAELIMFGKAEKMTTEPFRYRESKRKPKSTLWSTDIRELRRVIAEHYETFMLEEGGDVSKTINGRSMSPYDVFMNCVTEILDFCPDYVFISDEQTKAYIRSRLKRKRAYFEKDERRQAKRVPFRDDMLHHGEFIHPESESPLLELTGLDREVTEMRLSGYTQQEIAHTFGVSQQAIDSRLKRIAKRLNICPR